MTEGRCDDAGDQETGVDVGEDGAAFRAVFRESFDAMVIADDEGRYVEVNPAACELFGLPREDLLGTSIANFAPDDFDFERAWRTFSEGENERGLFPLVRPGGERRIVEYSATRDVLPGHHLSVLRDVTEREADQERIRRQRDELDTLNRINELVRETIDDVVEARTRETIEETVCTAIADSGLYAFAAVGERDLTRGGIVVRTSAGVDDEWLERLGDLDPDAAESGPGVAAIRTDEIQTLDNDDIAALPGTARDIVVDSGARSLLVAPLTFGAVGYGFLAIGATRPEAFGEREIEGFSALANAVAFAANAVESKQSLSAAAATVLEIDVRDPESTIAAFAPEDGDVAVESLLPLDDASSLVYLRTAAAVADDEAVCEDGPAAVGRTRIVERSDDRDVVEAVVDERTPVHVLRDLGARVRRVSLASDGTWHLEVAVPPGRDVRTVVDALEGTYPSVTLASKGGEWDGTDSASGADALDRLTDRQRAVLEAAYHSGYYDWPRRGSSAEDLAAALDVAPQTVLEHLRKAERIVVEECL